MIANTAYFISLATIIAFPLAIAYWLLIHPFAHWWRRIGSMATYLIVGICLSILGFIIFQWRDTLLAVEFGVQAPLAIAGLGLFVLARYLHYKRRRCFSTQQLVGLPELSSDEGGQLITTGIYSKIRNPRYVETCLIALAFALFTNNLACYIVFAGYVPLICLVTILEERELHHRFGEPYEQYCREVPRFIPTLFKAPTSVERHAETTMSDAR